MEVTELVSSMECYMYNNLFGQRNRIKNTQIKLDSWEQITTHMSVKPDKI